MSQNKLVLTWPVKFLCGHRETLCPNIWFPASSRIPLLLLGVDSEHLIWIIFLFPHTLIKVAPGVRIRQWLAKIPQKREESSKKRFYMWNSRLAMEQNGFYNDRFLNIWILSLEYNFLHPNILSQFTHTSMWFKYKSVVRSKATDPFRETLVIVVPVSRH